MPQDPSASSSSAAGDAASAIQKSAGKSKWNATSHQKKLKKEAKLDKEQEDNTRRKRERRASQSGMKAAKGEGN